MKLYAVEQTRFWGDVASMAATALGAPSRRWRRVSTRVVCCTRDLLRDDPADAALGAPDYHAPRLQARAGAQSNAMHLRRALSGAAGE